MLNFCSLGVRLCVMFSVALAADVRVQINSTYEPSSHLLSATAPSVLRWRIGTFLSVPKGLC